LCNCDTLPNQRTEAADITIQWPWNAGSNIYFDISLCILWTADCVVRFMRNPERWPTSVYVPIRV
jgi:hypothetical protein